MQEPLAALIEALLYIHSFFIFKKKIILLEFIYLANFVVSELLLSVRAEESEMESELRFFDRLSQS